MKAALRGSAFAKARPPSRGLFGHPAEVTGEGGSRAPPTHTGRPRVRVAHGRAKMGFLLPLPLHAHRRRRVRLGGMIATMSQESKSNRVSVIRQLTYLAGILYLILFFGSLFDPVFREKVLEGVDAFAAMRRPAGMRGPEPLASRSYAATMWWYEHGRDEGLSGWRSPEKLSDTELDALAMELAAANKVPEVHREIWKSGFVRGRRGNSSDLVLLRIGGKFVASSRDDLLATIRDFDGNEKEKKAE